MCIAPIMSMNRTIGRTFLIEEEDLQKVKELAEKKGCSENAVVRGLIREAKL